MPSRLQLSRRRGWRLPTGAVNVARPTRWGNPFAVEEYGRAQAIERYAHHLDQELAAGRLWLEDLRGRDLACWCRLDESCHADLLLDRANRP